MKKNWEHDPIIVEIRKGMAAKGLKVPELATTVGMKKGDLTNYLHGKVSNAPPQLSNILSHLQLGQPGARAPRELGRYDRSDFNEKLDCEFKTIRLSGERESNLGGSLEIFRTTFTWPENSVCAIFKESGRAGEKNHSGKVATFEGNPIIYLLSHSKNGHGFRQISLFEAMDGSLCGIILSNRAVPGGYRPSASMIWYGKDVIPTCDEDDSKRGFPKREKSDSMVS